MEESIADVLFHVFILLSVPLYTGFRQWMVNREHKGYGTSAESDNA
jgi:hypothetical protein